MNNSFAEWEDEVGFDDMEWFDQLRKNDILGTVETEDLPPLAHRVMDLTMWQIERFLREGEDWNKWRSKD